ncbi:Rhamnan synthesis protein F [compost metagenome]
MGRQSQAKTIIPSAVEAGGGGDMRRSVRRLGVFLFWDPQEIVHDYVKVSLAALRPFFETLIVVVNGQVDREGQDALAAVADQVWYRENTGFDVGGYKYAVDRLGVEAIAAYDEFVLLNYTFYAPLADLGAMFERMDASGVDFWGVTDFKDTRQNFVQSYFIAARSRLTGSQAFADYWAAMPPIVSIDDSIEHHEKAFTAFFAAKGFSWEVAFPTEAGEFGNITIASPIHQMMDGCPTLKYRAFTFPLESLRHREAPYPARTMDHVRRKTGYDAGLMVDHLVRSTSPTVIAANLQTVTVASSGAGEAAASLGRVGLFLNVADTAALGGFVQALSPLARRCAAALHVRVASAEMEAEVRRVWPGAVAAVRVGETASNVAALFAWADEVDFRGFDLVLSLGEFAGGRRMNAWLDNRLSFYVANLAGDDGVLNAVARQFDDRAVDMVMSPLSPYLDGDDGGFWQKHRPDIRRMADHLGVRGLDEASGLYAPHAAFWMRGDAVAGLADAYETARGEGGADLGEHFNRLLPALLAKRGKLAWRMVSADNAAQALAASAWTAFRSSEVRIEQDRELERRLAGLQLANEDLERALKAARTRISQARTELQQALADKAALEAGQETGRLAVAENRELRLLHNRTVEELATLRRVTTDQWRGGGAFAPLRRAGRSVKRAWRRLNKAAGKGPST